MLGENVTAILFGAVVVVGLGSVRREVGVERRKRR